MNYSRFEVAWGRPCHEEGQDEGTSAYDHHDDDAAGPLGVGPHGIGARHDAHDLSVVSRRIEDGLLVVVVLERIRTVHLPVRHDWCVQ